MSSVESATNTTYESTAAASQKETSGALPIVLPEPPLICALPKDILVILVQTSDIHDVAMLAYTCQALYNEIFTKTSLTQKQLCEIFSGLLLQDLEKIERFCKRTPTFKLPIELRISECGPKLLSALTIIQQHSPISGLIFQHTAIDSLDLQLCATKYPSLKKLTFQNCSLPHSIEMENVAVEELHLRSCTTKREDFPLSALFSKSIPSLKRLIIYECDTLLPDFDQFKPFSNTLEYFSHDGWTLCPDSPHRHWSRYTDLEANELPNIAPPVESLTSGCHAYYLGSIFLKTEPQLAKQYFQKSIALSPRLIHPKEKLAKLLFKTDPKEAEALLRECLAIYPLDIHARCSLARLLASTNRTTEGVKILQEVVLLGTQTGMLSDFPDIAATLQQYDHSLSAPFVRQLIYLAELIGSGEDILSLLSEELHNNIAAIKSGQLPIDNPLPDNLFEQLFSKDPFSYIQQAVLPEFEQEIKQALEKSLWRDISAWFTIFTCLKKSEKDISQLLDGLCITECVGISTEAKCQFLTFLAKPEWQQERRYFLSHFLLEKSLLQAGGMGNCVHALTGNKAALEDLCDIACTVASPEDQAMLASHLPETLGHKKIQLLYNALRELPNDYSSLYLLGQLLAQQKMMSRAEHFFARAATCILKTRCPLRENVAMLHETLSTLGLLPDFQKKLKAQLDMMPDEDSESEDVI